MRRTWSEHEQMLVPRSSTRPRLLKLAGYVDRGPQRRLHLGALLMIGIVACASGQAGLPPDVRDPAAFKTPAGALALYRGVLALPLTWFGDFAAETGVLTDELASLPLTVPQTGFYTTLDSRVGLGTFPSGQNYYSALHYLRGQAQEARGFLATYAVADTALAHTVPELRAHLFALEGYAEVLLADLYCSGIPLSTVDFQGDYTLTPGYKTEDVYAHAVTLFDSTLTLAVDSTRFRNLAAVGRGRALLAMGQYAAAAAAVVAVPDGFRYDVTGPVATLAEYAQRYGESYYGGTPSVPDREGQSGLDYRSSGDPRVPIDTLGQDLEGHTMYFPGKYPHEGNAAFALADAVEARLIEAEAALHGQLPGGPDWLTILNTLRQTVGLADTTDPGSDTARVSLLFRERAFWLYLTGHRQGDLRRLMRNYGRNVIQVYPFGTYPGGTGLYGGEVVVPVPESERTLNSHYTGCIHLDA